MVCSTSLVAEYDIDVLFFETHIASHLKFSLPGYTCYGRVDLSIDTVFHLLERQYSFTGVHPTDY